MSESFESGVLYTEHTELTAMVAGAASLWSYETRAREDHRRAIRVREDGSHEYWLRRSDPLLNSILPGTGVSVVLNFGDAWSAGLTGGSALLPRACVVGAVTKAKILRLGRSVRAVGAGLTATQARGVFGVPAPELVDRIVPLEELWGRTHVERLFSSFRDSDHRRCLLMLRAELAGRSGLASHFETAAQRIRLQGGRVSIQELAESHGLSRQQFARSFGAETGLPPKVFARITRFQALLHVLLETDVSEWASLPAETGYYDQAHMINEFRGFTGSAPTAFFLARDGGRDQANGVRLRGRPSEWLCRAEDLRARAATP